MRYHITLHDDRGGLASEALADPDADVVSTISNFDGTHDLALIDVPDEDTGEFEAALEDDGNVIEYQSSSEDGDEAQENPFPDFVSRLLGLAGLEPLTVELQKVAGKIRMTVEEPTRELLRKLGVG